MKRCFEVGVYGCSVFLAGIEAALKIHNGVRVQWLGNSLAEALWEIRMLSPQAVLFEINNGSQAVISAIKREYPSIKIMGLSPESGIVTVICGGEQDDAMSAGGELIQVIEQCAGKVKS